MRLETPRLVLRPPEAADADAIFTGIGDWQVARMLARPPWPYRRQDAVDWLTGQAALQRAGEAHAFAIALKEAPQTCIGVIGVQAEEDGEHHLGFWLARAYWGRGLASEAARAVLRAAFADPRLARVRSGCLLENAASRRVHEKLGFRALGESPLHSVPRGRAVPHLDFALDRADWRDGGPEPVVTPDPDPARGLCFAPGPALARDADHPVRLAH